MSKAAHWRWAVICASLAFLVGMLFLRILLTNSFGYMGSSWKGSGHADDGGLSAAFQIQGDATGPVSPGIKVPLDLRFTNPHEEAMTVTHLRVTVRKLTTPEADADHPCSISDYRLIQLASSVLITLPPAATTGLDDLRIPTAAWPQIGMPYRSVNQDGCRGATLKLGYAAFGTLVN